MKRTKSHIQELDETQSSLSNHIFITLIYLLGAFLISIAVGIIGDTIPPLSSPVLGIITMSMTFLAILCTANCFVDTVILLICRHKKQCLEKTVEKVAACIQPKASV